MKFVLYILACVAAVSVFISDAQAQMSSVEIDILRLKFRNFEYDSVITLAAKLLQERESLSTADQIKVLEMKAISHYSLLEMNASLSCFLEILKLDSSYELDPIKTSPKILSFFNEIKAGFQQEAASPPAASADTAKEIIQKPAPSVTPLRNAMARSLLLPGWGHHYLHESKKAWPLCLAGAITLGAGIYFAFDCREKERDYLNEIDKAQMDAKYQKYNRSYQARNILLSSFAAIWLYSQIDILLFQKQSPRQVSATLSPNVLGHNQPGICCAIKF